MKKIILNKDTLIKIGFISSLIVLALVIRLFLIKHSGLDVVVYVQWYDFIKLHGGLSAFKYNFADYNVPYLYLLLLATYIPFDKLIVIKIISISFDFILAFFAYKIMRLKFKEGLLPFFTSITILFTPTVFINSSYWGQTDAIYTSFLLMMLYFFMTNKNSLGYFLFAISFIIKPQAIFLLPIVGLIFISKKINYKDILALISPYIIFTIPVLFIGRSIFYIIDQFKLQAGLFKGIVYNAPNITQWFPQDQGQYFKPIAVILTLAATLLICFVVFLSKKKLNFDLLLKLSLLFSIIWPFFLPGMHDRYTFISEILSIMFAYCYKKYFYIPILICLSSFFVYMNVLFNRVTFNPQFLAFPMLISMIIVTYDLIVYLNNKEN